MSFLAPAAAVLGLTIPAIIALYFLKIRRPTRVVPALHLWPSQIRDRQANVPWQRLRPSWLLFLQLLAAAALVAAAVQPVLPAGASLARHSIVLLDASASMQATDVTPSRLAEAKRQVNAVIDQLGPSDRMTVIAVGPSSRIIASVTGDRDALHRAVNGIAAAGGFELCCVADLVVAADEALIGDAHANFVGFGPVSAVLAPSRTTRSLVVSAATTPWAATRAASKLLCAIS